MFFSRLAALLSVFLCVQAVAANYSVHVGPNGYAPYSIVERTDGEVRYHGIMFDLLDSFEATHPEYQRTLSLLTRKRANLKMANGDEIDLMFNSPLFVSQEIKQHYQFTVPLIVTKDVVITHKNADFSYENAADLNGKSVGTIRGYSYGEFDKFLENGFIRDVRVDHHTQAIGMLQKGRIDAYFGNIFVSPHYIKQLGLSVDDFIFSDYPMYEFEFAFAVNNQKPDLLNKLNLFIQRIKTDGTLQAIVKNYVK